MCIYLKDEYSTTKEDAQKVRAKFTYTKLKDLLTKSEILFDNKNGITDANEDREFIRSYKDFTEYVGRTIRPMQLRPGNQEWIIGTSNNVPYIRWNRNQFVPGDYDIYVPEFSYTDTVLYVFVK